MAANQEKKSGKSKKIITISVISVLLIAVAVLVYLLLNQQKSVFNPKMKDQNAVSGQLEGKSEKEIEAELNRIVEEGMFHISINPQIIMPDGNSEAELRIENVPSNHYLMSVKITLDDSGEVVYTSGMIEPDYHIQSAKLDQKLKKGTYEATAVFTAYDPDTQAEKGQASAKIVFIVNR